MPRASLAIIMPPESPDRPASPRPAGNGARRPAICLITDRRRLLAALDLPADAWRAALLAQIAGAVAGGGDVVQLRERDLDAGVRASFARDCGRVVHRAAARFVVNERVDIALACGADGVHLREDGVLPPAVRRLCGEAFLVGRSVHTAQSASHSEGADYLIAGPIRETVSKPGQAALGVDGFGAIVAEAPCPVWAIGGITPLHSSAIAAAGAAGIAAIGAFIPAGPRPAGDLAARVRQLAMNLRFTFDSLSSVP